VTVPPTRRHDVENGLPNGVKNPSGSQGEIKSFTEDSRGPAGTGALKSYPESTPCEPIAKGSPLSYKGGQKAGTDGNY
jgi:hypothetical protein